VVHNPEMHQSAKSFAELIVGPAANPTKYDGQVVKVTYDTLVGFSSVSSYVLDRRRRIAGESPLVRAYHPIYVQFTLEYDLKKSATEALDEETAVDFLISYVNSFPPTEVLDVSSLTDAFRQAFPVIGHVYPFTIYYDVHVPDGRVVPFQTQNTVIVPASTELLDTLLVSPGDPTSSLYDPLAYGLTDDVTRYLTRRELIYVQRHT